MGALGISELQVVCRNWQVTKYKRLSELPLELLRPAVNVSNYQVMCREEVVLLQLPKSLVDAWRLRVFNGDYDC